MMKINTELLNQFAKEVLSTNEGIAVDVRLVRSASRPISNADIKSLGDKKSSEGKIDKTGQPIKFSRDAESDCTIKNDERHYGLKEHASVDINNGFILATTITPASHNDLPLLALPHYHCTIYSLHTDQNLEPEHSKKVRNPKIRKYPLNSKLSSTSSGT